MQSMRLRFEKSKLREAQQVGKSKSLSRRKPQAAHPVISGLFAINLSTK